jgi:hypothetical protein
MARRPELPGKAKNGGRCASWSAWKTEGFGVSYVSVFLVRSLCCTYSVIAPQRRVVADDVVDGEANGESNSLINLLSGNSLSRANLVIVNPRQSSGHDSLSEDAKLEDVSSGKDLIDASLKGEVADLSALEVLGDNGLVAQVGDLLGLFLSLLLDNLLFFLALLSFEKVWWMVDGGWVRDSLGFSDLLMEAPAIVEVSRARKVCLRGVALSSSQLNAVRTACLSRERGCPSFHR